MGILLKGIWKGVEYDNKEVTADKLADIFGVKEDVMAKGKSPVVTFSLDKSKKKVVNGQKRCINRLTVPSRFTFNEDGENITVTYFSKRLPKTDKKTKIEGEELTPRKIDIESQEFSLLRTKYLDKIVYLAIHPQCSTSPLYQKGNEKTYGLRNFDKEAKTFLTQFQMENEIFNDILKTPEPTLRIRAKGMDVGNVDNLTYEAIQAALIDRFNRARAGIGAETVATFKTKWESGYSGVKGQVQECVDAGYIMQDMVLGGKTRYTWKPGIGAEGVICTVEKGLNPIDYLVNHVVSNWDTYKGLVEDVLKYGNERLNDDVNTMLDKMGNKSATPQKKEMTAGDYATEAQLNNLLMFNFPTKGIHWIKDGKLEAEPFMVAEFSTWQQELAVELEKNDELLTTLKNKLKGKNLAKAKADKK